MPHLELSLNNDILSFVNDSFKAPLPKQGPGYNIEIVTAVISLFGREKREVQVAIVMINRASATISSGQFNAMVIKSRQVGLDPGVLVSANDHAGIVSPEQQNMMIGKVVVPVKPVLEREVGEDVPRLGDENGFLDGALGDVLNSVRGRVGPAKDHRKPHGLHDTCDHRHA